MRDIELREYQMLQYFDARLTSGDTGYMKPHPTIYQKALDLLGVEARQALFVGDRPANDIAGANDAGMVSVLMSPLHLERDLEGVCPNYTISCLSELLPILKGMENDGREKTGS
jgi:putative hydrolase of the HAD superfamily